MLFGARAQIYADFTVDREPVRVTMRAPKGPDACMWAYLDDWSPLFPGSLPDDQRLYWTGRLEDPDDLLTRAMLRPVAFDLARQVYGVPWWTANRILRETESAYLSYETWCVKHAFRPADETARRIIASVVGFVSEQWQEQQDARSWWQRMSMPPVGVRG